MISGKTLRDAIISGANNIASQKRMVDELNVFPVPDGDTGTNMSMTSQAGAKALKSLPESTTVAEVAKTAAAAFLRGARGNSGVILSLLFRGFSKGLSGKKSASSADLVEALQQGVEAAYKAVMKPTEGTVLTVARVAGEQAAEALKKDPEIDSKKMWNLIVSAAKEALATTPDLLPVLKKAGVVDAGGQGFCFILEGMEQVIAGGKIVSFVDTAVSVATPEHVGAATGRNAAGEVQGDIRFAYCTEFIAERETDRDPLTLRAYLETIGDCVVVVDDDDIIKVHVHTNAPGKALQEGLKFGPLTSMKIENMKEQHSHQVMEVEQARETPSYVPVDPAIRYGFVAVAAGKGLESLFLDLGCSYVVSGGQTMNPSTEDILAAVQSVPAQTIFVLPNNKNIIMSAEQAGVLADRRVIVLPTVTIPQGVGAMLAFDVNQGELDNQLSMNEAARKVGSGQITYAARDSDFEGKKIKKGDILAMAQGKLSFVENDMGKAVTRLAKSLLKKDSELVTLFYGQDVKEMEAERLCQTLSSKLGKEIEVTLVNGGQPVYYYLISVE